MLSTVILIAYLLGLVAGLLLTVWFLHLGTKRVGAAAPSFWKALGAHLLGNVLVIGIVFIPLPNPQSAWIQLACLLVVPLAVIAAIYKLTMWKAFQAWLWTLIPVYGLGVVIAFVVRPYVIENYMIPTNSMAPTILGRHLIEPCPSCGQPAYCSPWPDDQDPRGFEFVVICSRELRSRKVVVQSPKVYSGDRILVAKFLRPQRWDLAVFQYPEDPTVPYIKRLVGLPGETVVIKDGSIWINGQKQAVPDAIRGIEYLDKLEGIEMTLWGSAERPAKLGDGEYFMLGDFSAAAKDARLWEIGAPGHPPYAVPESHLIGVATHIYWPPSRWGRLR